MEEIKKSPSVEFDVIYADGTRRRVQEGVLYEAADGGGVIFHSGTSRTAVVLAVAETMLVLLKDMFNGLAALAIGMSLTDKSRSALRDLSWFVNDLLEDRSANEQGIFRLGQMDMREAVCDLIRDEAKKIPSPDGFRIYGLIDKIEELEVLSSGN